MRETLSPVSSEEEQVLYTDQVGGSNPSLGTIFIFEGDIREVQELTNRLIANGEAFEYVFQIPDSEKYAVCYRAKAQRL